MMIIITHKYCLEFVEISIHLYLNDRNMFLVKTCPKTIMW